MNKTDIIFNFSLNTNLISWFRLNLHTILKWHQIVIYLTELNQNRLRQYGYLKPWNSSHLGYGRRSMLLHHQFRWSYLSLQQLSQNQYRTVTYLCLLDRNLNTIIRDIDSNFIASNSWFIWFCFWIWSWSRSWLRCRLCFRNLLVGRAWSYMNITQPR